VVAKLGRHKALPLPRIIEMIRSVFEKLNEKISYDELKIMRLIALSQREY